ncbi:hypothetical protein SBDP1_340017 [Syntrophobacter sp. SbD1]|nr:hypothetical protein SBDP1_340017 [Syntrophobacter sp. SbD1]
MLTPAFFPNFPIWIIFRPFRDKINLAPKEKVKPNFSKKVIQIV